MIADAVSHSISCSCIRLTLSLQALAYELDSGMECRDAYCKLSYGKPILL
jgi:hypothetical protein